MILFPVKYIDCKIINGRKADNSQILQNYISSFISFVRYCSGVISTILFPLKYSLQRFISDFNVEIFNYSFDESTLSSGRFDIYDWIQAQLLCFYFYQISVSVIQDILRSVRFTNYCNGLISDHQFYEMSSDNKLLRKLKGVKSQVLLCCRSKCVRCVN
ncbi:Hypothetical_protein [Hexamita inflata]|uniref:Hypothetical_protein n=1 Tax=Hexamita inflata TaxID=28002 RepID=A0AA86U3B8_9EUKA|nr:Hypothetical protein HINF_LOCUS25906 [Hexamita inflata]